MTRRVSIRSAVAIAGVGLLAAGSVSAMESTAATAKPWRVPRTAEGHPDLQGTWNSATLTRLERADRFGKRRALTLQEAAALEAAAAKAAADADRPSDPNSPDPNCSNLGPGCTYNAFWLERGTRLATIDGERRNSIIIEPSNGKVPPLLEHRQQQLATLDAARGEFDGPETLSLSDRCLLSFGPTAGPPMLPVAYNSRYQIVQTREHVMILIEMIHDVRIIHLDDRPLPSGVARWMGDSIGRWEGDTLVVETRNFHAQQSLLGSTPAMRVIERFTRTGPQTIRYRFTVEDHAAFEQSFTGEFPLQATRDLIYEYACHEGNYAMTGMLAAARKREGESVAIGPR